MRTRRNAPAFTLAELLISLAILGVIATFTIPKILQAQKSQQWNSVTKETVTTVEGAIQVARQKGTLQTSTTMGDLMQYMNYAKNDTSVAATIDYYYNGTPASVDCNTGAWYCIRMHNGSVIYYNDGNQFGGTASTNAIRFMIDPDGKFTDSTTNGPGKSIEFYLYWNGKLRNAAQADDNSTTYFGATMDASNAWTGTDPPWFSWN